MTTRPLSLTVNGKQIGPIDVPDDMMMQDFLHEYLNLTGSRMGCGEGVCGPAPLPLHRLCALLRGGARGHHGGAGPGPRVTSLA